MKGPKQVAYKAKSNPNPQKPVPTAPYYYDGTQRADPKKGKVTKTYTESKGAKKK